MASSRLWAFASGRIGRQTYMIYTGGHLTLYVLLVTGVPAFPTALVLPWPWIVWVASRRLHDVGRTGWWALLPFGTGVVQGFVAAIERRAISLATGAVGPVGSTLAVIVVLVTIALMIGLAVMKGDEGENRFGSEPLTW
jgi:uncharacterized membrane protein YhaH (DUF805 family)